MNMQNTHSTHTNNIGKWSLEEHILYLEGLILFGKDMNKIQKYVGTRTIAQVRTHDQKCGKKPIKKSALEILYEVAVCLKTPPS
jgi:hypothetical protein